MTETQIVSLFFVRKSGSPALERHYLVEMSQHVGNFAVYECFVSGGEQQVPLAGCAKIAPKHVIGTVQAPLIGSPHHSVGTNAIICLLARLTRPLLV